MRTTLLCIVTALMMPLFANESDLDMMDPELMEFFGALYGDPVEEAGFKLDEFGQKLQINDSQAQSWEAFKQFFLTQMAQKQNRAHEFRELIKSRNGVPFTTPEALSLHLQHLELQQQDTEAAKSVIDSLYAVLNPTQQHHFDRAMRYLWFKDKQRKGKQ